VFPHSASGLVLDLAVVTDRVPPEVLGDREDVRDDEPWQTLAKNEWIRECTGALAAARDLPGPPPDAQGPFAVSDPTECATSSVGAGSPTSPLDHPSEPPLTNALAQA